MVAKALPSCFWLRHEPGDGGAQRLEGGAVRCLGLGCIPRAQKRLGRGEFPEMTEVQVQLGSQSVQPVTQHSGLCVDSQRDS